MRTILLITLLTGCAQKLPVRSLPAFASSEAWCAQLRGATCKGEWPDAKPGTSALGAYRFLLIEASAIDNFGGGPSVSMELKTPAGFVYAPLGAIGATGTTGSTTLNVESVTEHGQALDVRTHLRTLSTKGMGDAQDAVFFVAGGSGTGVAHVHLGANRRDELGRATGSFGTLKWEGETLISAGTRLKDGEYRLVGP